MRVLCPRCKRPITYNPDTIKAFCWRANCWVWWGEEYFKLDFIKRDLLGLLVLKGLVDGT